MDKFKEKPADNTPQPELTPSEIADNAIERMMTGAVVKEERTIRFKFSIIVGIIVAAIAAFSTFNFKYQTPTSETAANGNTVVTLKQDSQGHYLATGKINGKPVKFLVDTGATQVSIPMTIAKELGLPLGLKRKIITANGYGSAYDTNIQSVELGGIKLNGISAGVSEGLVDDTALLGMSFLRRTKITQEKGVMTITY